MLTVDISGGEVEGRGQEFLLRTSATDRLVEQAKVVPGRLMMPYHTHADVFMLVLKTCAKGNSEYCL